MTSSNGAFSALLTLVRGIQRWSVNSPHKGQWRGSLMFSSMCAWINDWVNNHEAGDLSRHRAHYDVIVMWGFKSKAMNINTVDITGMDSARKNAIESDEAVNWMLLPFIV